MSSRKHDRKWTTAGAAMVAGATLGYLPVAAFALGGGDAPFTVAVPASASCIDIKLEPTAEAVKGAPYSGVGTTEVVTTLADGNRITRTNTMHYFRDSAGRMRTEYQLAAIGPFVPQESQSIVTITDPVAGKRYVLHPSLKRADVFDLSAERGASVGVAGKAILVGGVSTNIGAAGAAGFAPTTGPARGFRTLQPRAGRGAGTPPAGNTLSTTMAPGFAASAGIADTPPTRVAAPAAGIAVPATPGVPPPGSDVLFTASGPAISSCAAGPNVKAAPQAVSIGERRIEGLKVTGSRLEFTINAGEVGNEQPITVRTDQWFSPELGVVVSSTHNDPMIGETTYRLEQIDRKEPDAALFAVPTDYSKLSLDR